MANPNKAKGTAFETAIVNYLNEGHPVGASRLPLSGPVDKGDIVVHSGPTSRVSTIQAKAVKAIDLAGFVDDANKQSAAAGTWMGVAVVKRRGKNIKDAYVVMDLETFRRVLEAL